MSTHDSYLIAWSAVLTQDVIAPLRRRELSDRQRIWITRGIILLIGVFLLVFGLWYQAPTQLWSYMAVTGSIYFAGAFVVITAGMYWRRASSMGANFALAAGLFSILGLMPWAEWGLGWINEAKVGLCTVTLAVIGMVVGSILFPDKEQPTEGLVHAPIKDERPQGREEAS
jgi:SSS family solute:Na+ symporter